MSSGSSARQPGSESAVDAARAGDDPIRHTHPVRPGEPGEPQQARQNPSTPAAGEPVDRILSSLDRLGDRIRSLSATSANVAAVHAARASADRQALHASPGGTLGSGQYATELQKVMEQIARKRDLTDDATATDPASAPQAPPRQSADLSHLHALRADIAAVREIVEAGTSVQRLQALEANYDEIVRRLDQMHGAIDNPRTVADLVQRLSEIRRMLAQAPTDTQIETIAERLDRLEARLGSSDGEADLAEMERQVGALAAAIGGLDTSDLLIAIDTRLDQVGQQVAQIEQRLAGSDQVDERHETILSSLAQRTEQLPRIAHEMERQSAVLDDFAREFATLPPIMIDIADLRGTVDAEAIRAQKGLQALLDRMEEITSRADMETSAERLAIFVDERLAEIGERFEALAGSVDTATLAALDERFSAFEAKLAERLSGAVAGLEKAAPPAELVDALARIEAHLERNDERDRFAALEDRIAGIATSVDRVALPDGAALETALAGLREDVAGLAGTAFAALETEVRSLAGALEGVTASGISQDQLARIEHRISAIAERLDHAPTDMSRLEEVLTRFESTLVTVLGSDRLIGEAARAAALAAVAEGDAKGGDKALEALRADLAALQRDWLAGAERDRSLLASIGSAVERLSGATVGLPDRRPGKSISSAEAAGEPPARSSPLRAAASPAPGPIADVVAEAPAEPSLPQPSEPAVEPSTWSEIERTMTAGVEPEESGAPTGILAADPDVVFGEERRVDEPAKVSDDDRPLEPGSGKPPRRAGSSSGQAEPVAIGEGRIEPSKADFIAAARRAAQAASMAPDVISEATGQLRSGRERGSALKRWSERMRPALDFMSRRKRVMLATTAIIVFALAVTTLAVPTVKRLTAPPQPTAAVDSPAPAEADDGSATAADLSSPVAETLPDETATAAEDVDAPASIDTTTSSGFEPAAMSSETVEPSYSSETGAGPAAGAADADQHAANAQTAEAAPDGTLVTPVDAQPSPLPESIGSIALRQAAMAGDPGAQLEIAARFTEGRGVPQDFGEAIRWYRLAADGGLALAQYRLGSFFEKGHGVPRDLKTAASWYRSAAVAGNIKAMHNLAVLSAEGIEGSPDYVAAALWFQVAAELGVRDSQYNLGILHAKGLGLPQDMIASYKWFAIAANGGDTDAARKRDDIAQVLDKEALARARLAVETWSARSPAAAANEAPAGDPAWLMAPEQTAAVGPDEASISDIQARLATLGYDPGPADGRIGERTRAAIEKFQADRGLDVTGAVDAGLVQALSEQQT